MTQTEDFSKRAVPLASALLGATPSQFTLEDITSTFEWANKYRIYWALTSLDRRSVVIAFRRDGAPLVTTSSSGTAVVSLILTDETGALPDGIGPLRLAEAFRELTVSPQGRVGSPELFKPALPPLEAWIRSNGVPPDVQKKLILQNSTGPTLHADSKNKKWALDFAYFNEHGGIEGWHLEGNERLILSAAQKTIAQNDTLNWPFE